ncbi:MAG: hypothetical protein KAR21_23485, partial [Spirochaetales bacterium]|nr:hypothetical protein [Spirochaetales bacterium]
MKKGSFNLLKKYGLNAAGIIITLLLSSCPNQLTRVMVSEVLDSVVPVVRVTTPEDGDAYGAYTLVAGTVSDLSDAGESGKIASLSVEILGVTGNKSIPVNGDGSFSYTLETNGAGYSGDIVIKLTALDWNGNSTETTLALEKAAGEIADFTVTAGNRSTLIEWEPLPGAISYSIQELLSGDLIEGITDTSYIWNGLTNGNLYSFRVLVEIDGGTYFSSIKDAIPLSKTTLTPQMESAYRGINLFWQDIPAASKYVVERSEYLDGPYSIRTITVDPFYYDENLDRGAGYYYRVYPVERIYNSEIMISSSNYGSAGYFHGLNDYSVFSGVITENACLEVFISDDHNYAYLANGTSGLWIINISDPANPSIVGHCDTPGDNVDTYGNAQGVVVEGNYAYISNRESGLVVIDILNHAAPFIAGGYDPNLDPDLSDCRASQAAINGNNIYMALQEGG